MKTWKIILQLSYLLEIFLQLIDGLFTKQATRTWRKKPEDREMKEKAINDIKTQKMHLLLYSQSQSMIIMYDCVNINLVIYQLHWLT